jgi:PKD repeat protein
MDEGGLSDVSETTVGVTNAAPSVSAHFAAAAVNCGPGNATLNVSFTDPGPDTFTASVDWGDGSAPESLGAVASPFSATRAYAAAGNYTATATVTDDDGGADTAGDSVRVNYDVTVLRPLGDPAKDVFKSTSTIPVKISVADCDGSHPADLEPRLRVVDTGLTGTMRFADGQYVYNISGKTLPDPRGTYHVEITLPNRQVVTTSFRLKP